MSAFNEISEPAEQVLKGLNVLAVDDENMTLGMLEDILEMEGAIVATATDGKSAFTLASTQPFDVILMDYQMPEWDGVRATQEIRNIGITTPIIALTAASEAEKDELLSLGMNDYYQKPVEFDSLLELIAKWGASA
ncbi:response regulator [Aliikangiella sp. G2MR2-5]|uniref:response regulator n=1 Tax=Aliikangiella sp. G2MR2-5 TaxID=2788943 RepID=UPI0018AB59B4|nr:response regulator [Aliikangiella sp. G2MR2-5]